MNPDHLGEHRPATRGDLWRLSARVSDIERAPAHAAVFVALVVAVFALMVASKALSRVAEVERVMVDTAGIVTNEAR